MLTPSFVAELAAIDACLHGRARQEQIRIEYEIAELEPRRAAADAVGLNDLVDKIDALLADRRLVLAALCAYQALSPSTTAMPDAGKAPEAPVSIPIRIEEGQTASLKATPSISIPISLETPKEGGPLERLTAPSTPSPEPKSTIPSAEPAPVIAEIVSPIEPEVVRAPIPPRPKPSATVAQFRRFVRELGDKEMKFYKNHARNEAWKAELKSLTCEARALSQLAHELDEDESVPVESLGVFRNLFNEYFPGGQFFAFNQGRHHNYSTWRNLSDAFRLLSTAIDCLDWLRNNAVDKNARQELIMQCGAAEAWIHRICDSQGLGFVDDQQRDVHREVEELAKQDDLFVPWWMTQGEGARQTTEIISVANKLPTTYAAIRERIEKAGKREVAMELLQELANSIESVGDFESTVLPAIVRCLDAGIPPSDKALCLVCLPYRTLLQEMESKQVAKLVEYLTKLENKLAASKKAPSDSEDSDPALEADPEFAAKLEAVRQHLKGRKLMFVGGRKLAEKKNRLEKELGLAELVWPDAEPDTLVKDFHASTHRADVVCYLIRWSRHSYKQVIDLAKSLGKETVTIKAGVGVRRLVNDIYDQLLSHQEKAA